MRRKSFVRLALLAGVLALMVGLGPAAASSAPLVVEHGITLTKGCSSTPTPIGSPVLCSFTVRNNVDDAGDTLSVTSLVDTVHSAFAGDVTSANILRVGQLTTTATANAGPQTGSVCYTFVRQGSDLSATNGSTTVTSASAAFSAADVGRTIDIDGTPYLIASVTNATTADLGTAYGASNNSPSGTNLPWIIGFVNPAEDGSSTGLGPYTNSGFCVLPNGSRVNVLPFSHYTAHKEDFALPSHRLNDDATMLWNDVCNGLLAGPPPGGGNCNPDPPSVGAGSSSIIAQIPSVTTTDIHNAAHQVVTAVAAGTTVHDFVTVTGTASGGAPTGNVNVSFFNNNTCTAPAAAGPASAGPLVDQGGGVATVDATGFAQGPLAAGSYGFQATYPGDATYTASPPGACEPLQVVDAYIQITPQNATNPVGTNHVLTITVTATNGGVLAGGTAQATILPSSTTGNFVGPSSCSYAGGGTSASCTVTITSLVAGSTDVQASSNISFGNAFGSVTRTTGTATNLTAGCPANCNNANKLWIAPAAHISIAPNATNPVGAPHTFTVTLTKDTTGGGTFVPAAGEHVDVTLMDNNGAVHTAPTGSCTNAGPNTDANGQCTITFTSNSAGTVTGSATATLLISGITVTATTNGANGNSVPAVKTFVDANIQITPNGTNPVGATHTFTAHVNVNDGSGAGFVPAPNGTVITFTIDSDTASSTPNPPASCTTSGGTGSCTTSITSLTPGTTVVSAHTTVVVGGVSLTRATNGVGANSGPATKLWADDTIVTHVRDAANNDVTNKVVTAGTVVHDEATVAKKAGTPAGVPDPTGTVNFTLFDNGSCNGNVIPGGSQNNVPLGAGGTAVETTTFTAPAAGGSFSYQAVYSGDANYPAHTAACEPFTVPAPPKGQITPTNVDCTDILGGTAPTLGQINYSGTTTIAQSINPGVFFFWTKITTTSANQVVTVTQSNNSTNNAALFLVHQGWDRVYAGDCSSYRSGTQSADGSGASFTIPVPGDYIIGIKYQTKSIAGTPVPNPLNITYTFNTSLGGQTSASVLLKHT